MVLFRLFSAAEQVAAHLREGLLRGDWSGGMPGVKQLAADLGINHKTAEAALRLLEREGLLAGQGPGRPRRIVVPEKGWAARPLRVGILLNEVADRKKEYLLELLHQLADGGHTAFFARKTLTEFCFNLERVANLVEAATADAWVVVAGSRAVLEWFNARPAPVFALFGRRLGLPIAGGGPNTPSAVAAATRALMDLGHRRIVMVIGRIHRNPPGAIGRSFLEALAAGGNPTGPFNLPDWEETTEGLQKLLNELFHFTPPTALIVDEVPFFVAVQQFLAQRRVRVPQDVSLVSTDPDPAFAHCVPSIAHCSWDSAAFVRRIVQWATHVSRGQRDLQQTFSPEKFVPGGTVGPVRKG